MVGGYCWYIACMAAVAAADAVAAAPARSPAARAGGGPGGWSCCCKNEYSALNRTANQFDSLTSVRRLVNWPEHKKEGRKEGRKVGCPAFIFCVCCIQMSQRTSNLVVNELTFCFICCSMASASLTLPMER